MREASGDLRFCGKVSDLPFVLRVKQERLSDDACLPSQTRRSGPDLAPSWLSPTFEMEEQARQLDVGVAEAVEEGDSMLSENLPNLCSGVTGDHEQWSVGVGLCLVHELPGRGRVRARFELDGDRSPVAGELHEGIDSKAGGYSLCGDRDPRSTEVYAKLADQALVEAIRLPRMRRGGRSRDRSS
jgi:hypothetical protein